MNKNKVLIIAEAGVNHNGDLNTAKQLIEIASDSGADIVKFQTFNSKKLTTNYAEKANYQKNLINKNETQQELLLKLEMSHLMHHEIKKYSDKLGIEFCSTAFDIESLKFLISLGIKRIKIPSGEITNLHFLKFISLAGLPVIMSTGMSNIDEIKNALAILTSGNLTLKDITVLHCNSSYPTPINEVNLSAMKTIR